MSESERDVLPQLVALLFVSPEPVALEAAARVLEVDRPTIEAAVERLRRAPPPGLTLLSNDGHVELATAPECGPYVERFLGAPEQTRLSRAALEVLAIVAYRQPITRAEIEAVRGVNGDRALATLLQRQLVAEVGRRETVGRPALFGTTVRFLEYVGISSLADLPPLPSPDPEPAPPGRGRSEPAPADGRLTGSAHD